MFSKFFLLFWLFVKLLKSTWITDCWLHCIYTKECGTVGAKRKVKVTHLEVSPRLNHHHFFKEKLGHGITFDPILFQTNTTYILLARSDTLRFEISQPIFLRDKSLLIFSHWLIRAMSLSPTNKLLNGRHLGKKLFDIWFCANFNVSLFARTHFVFRFYSFIVCLCLYFRYVCYDVTISALCNNINKISNHKLCTTDLSSLTLRRQLTGTTNIMFISMKRLTVGLSQWLIRAGYCEL